MPPPLVLTRVQIVLGSQVSWFGCGREDTRSLLQGAGARSARGWSTPNTKITPRRRLRRLPRLMSRMPLYRTHPRSPPPPRASRLLLRARRMLERATSKVSLATQASLRRSSRTRTASPFAAAVSTASEAHPARAARHPVSALQEVRRRLCRPGGPAEWHWVKAARRPARAEAPRPRRMSGTSKTTETGSSRTHRLREDQHLVDLPRLALLHRPPPANRPHAPPRAPPRPRPPRRMMMIGIVIGKRLRRT